MALTSMRKGQRNCAEKFWKPMTSSPPNGVGGGGGAGGQVWWGVIDILWRGDVVKARAGCVAGMEKLGILWDGEASARQTGQAARTNVLLSMATSNCYYLLMS